MRSIIDEWKSLRVVSSIAFILASSFSMAFAYWFYFQGITLNITLGRAMFFDPDSRVMHNLIYATLLLASAWISYSLLASRLFKLRLVEVMHLDAKTYLPLTLLVASSFKYFYYVRYAGYAILALTVFFFIFAKTKAFQSMRDGKTSLPGKINSNIISTAVCSYLILSAVAVPLYDLDRDDARSILFGGGDCDDLNTAVNPWAEDVPWNDVDEDCDGADFVFEYAGGDKPNVVLIVVDTLRADHLGYAGYGRNTSPNIDSLAGEGVVFTNAFAVAPCTFPSVNSMLTSQDAVFFNVNRYGMVHFNRFGGFSSNSKLAIPDSVETLAGFLKDRGYYTKAIITSPIVDSILGGKQGGLDDFNHVDGTCQDREHWVRLGFRSAECTTNQSIRWLEEYKSVHPFFLMVHYFDPHHYYEPPPPFYGLYGDYVSDNEYVNEGAAAAIQRAVRNDSISLTPEDVKHLVDSYDSEINYLDFNLGLVFDKLGELEVLNNTLIVFTSDHGEGFFEHPYSVMHCLDAYREQLHVPLFMRVPGVSPLIIDDSVSSLDVVPTLLDLLGFSFEGSGFEGRSLSPVFSGGSVGPGFTNFFEVRRPDEQVQLRGVQSSSGKLIYDVMSGSYEYFDLESDPLESVNVWDANLTESRRLKELLFDQMISDERMLDDVQGVGVPDDSVTKLLREMGYIR
ncbi:MAG: sulfatase-like hydrolase/transferase [Candidatus Altiarchaeota archaeon]